MELHFGYSQQLVHVMHMTFFYDQIDKDTNSSKRILWLLKTETSGSWKGEGG